MADIIKVDYTNITDTLTAISRQPFQLSSYDDGAGPLYVASSTVEEIGGLLYVVDAGNVQITDGGVSDGIVYIKLVEDGDGTASVSLSETTGTWDGQKSGVYSGSDKFIGEMVKDSGNYNDRVMYNRTYSIRIMGELFANLNIETDKYFKAGLGRIPTFADVYGGGATENTLFDLVKGYIPNNNDEVFCSGWVHNDVAPGIIPIRMWRFSSTQIVFQGIQLDDTAANVTITDGNTDPMGWGLSF